jgi:hypothetical protein
MTLALLQPAAPLTPAADRPGDRVSPSRGGRPSLDEVISGAWAGLTAGAPVACPVCGGRMAPIEDGVGSCGSCSTWLS